MVKSSKVEGPWSEPVLVNQVKESLTQRLFGMMMDECIWYMLMQVVVPV